MVSNLLQTSWFNFTVNHQQLSQSWSFRVSITHDESFLFQRCTSKLDRAGSGREPQRLSSVTYSRRQREINQQTAFEKVSRMLRSLATFTSYVMWRGPDCIPQEQERQTWEIESQPVKLQLAILIRTPGSPRLNYNLRDEPKHADSSWQKESKSPLPFCNLRLSSRVTRKLSLRLHPLPTRVVWKMATKVHPWNDSSLILPRCIVHVCFPSCDCL